MKLEDAVESQIGHLVAADHDKIFVSEILFDLLHAAGAAEQLGFVRVVQLYAEARTVAERGDDRVGEIVHVDRDLVEAVRL